jgi:hypothetical protein
MASNSGRKGRSKSSRPSGTRSKSSSSRTGRSAGSRPRSSSAKSKPAASRSRSRSAALTSTGSRSRSTGRSRGSSSRGTRSASNRYLTGRDEIRQWAEDRGATPACVHGTGGSEDIGMIRLDFPGYSGEQSLDPIGWDEWFDKFEASGLALLVQDKTARGKRSNFNKLVSRQTATRGKSARRSTSTGGRKSSGRSGSSRKRAA